MEGTHTGAVCEELQPVGKSHFGEVLGGLFPVDGTPRWSRGREQGGRSEREHVMN